MLGFRRSLAVDPPISSPRGVPGLYAAWMADAGISSGAAWTDQSDNAFQLTQGTAGNRPTYVAADADGRPSVSFDGVDDFLAGPAGFSLPGDQALTVFAVLQPNSVAQGAYASPLGWGSGSGSLTAAAVLLNYVNGGQPSWQAGGGNGVSFPGPLSTGWQVLTFRKEPGPLATTLTARRNGVDMTPPSNTSANTPNVSAGTIYVGRFADYAGYYFAGKLREVLVYRGALTAADVSRVEYYLRRWPL